MNDRNYRNASSPAGNRRPEPRRSGNAQANRRAEYRPQPQNAANYRPRPQNADNYRRPARPAQHAAPVRARRKKKGSNPLTAVLKIIAVILLAVFGGIGKLFSALNRKLDVFRKSEASAVIVNCIAGGVVVVILLCVFMIFKTDIDAGRAGSLAAKGKIADAMRIVHTLEEKDYSAAKMQETYAEVAEGFIKNGEFDAVASLISGMPEGAQKQEMEKRNNYEKACAQYEKGDYTSAAQAFYQMGDYQDSALRYADCRCALAIEAWQQGDESSARSLLLDVPDLAQRVANAAVKVGGSEAEAQAILAADLFRTENLERMEHAMEELNAARSDMPQGRIAAGRYHTVALKNDGTLLGTGDNSFGQLNIGGWNGMTQIAAGAFHTVGLRADGTVLATGDNSQGQCEVSAWTDIVSVAASACDTIGLKSDGSVVACGKNSAKVSGWHDVSFVTGGSYSLGCLYDKGAMLSSHKSAQMPMGVSLYDLSVCGPVSAGVLYDGSLTSTFEGAPEWTEMISVTACETGILGIDVNGKVRSFFYRPGDAVEFNVPGLAVEVESSGTHHVVLTTDGSVFAFGNNDYGQCEVSGWQLR